MKRLLMTGITGKSGRVFARRLLERGQWTLRAAVRPASLTEQLQNAWLEVELCPADLYDEDGLVPLLEGVDVVLHIAGIDKSPTLLRAAARAGVKRLILVHTSGIYSKYKAAGELYRQIDEEVLTFAAEHDLALTILRPTMIYGTLKDQNIVKFIHMVDKLNPMPVVNHASYLLQPVHAEDLADAYLRILEHLDETAGKEYILSGRDPVLLLDLFRIIADELGVKRRFLSVPFWIAYPGAWCVYLLSLKRIDLREKVQRLCESRAYPHDAAVKDFGYAPIPFEEGLRREVREYINNKKNPK